jgi:hypothetical protein
MDCFGSRGQSTCEMRLFGKQRAKSKAEEEEREGGRLEIM